MTDRIEADYLLETAEDPARAAEALAGEQSCGANREGARATVDRLEILRGIDAPALPGATPGQTRLACVTLSWPLDNLGPSLPNLLATVAGDLFEHRAVSGLKLLELRLPREFGRANPGPRFGAPGTRRLAGADRGPLIGATLKPAVGLSPEETADRARALAEAGLDLIADDELQADGAHCPFENRVAAVMRAVRDHAERSGRTVMVAFNLTGDVDEMRARHDLVLAEGGTCVMASMHSVGLGGMLALARHSQLPIHAHRNGWGLLGRHPHHGVSFMAWSKLWRLAGADHLQASTLPGRSAEDEASVLDSARSLLVPLWDDAPMTAMPVLSVQAVRPAGPACAALGSDDLILMAGGDLLAHPQGPKAGVEALREAWAAPGAQR